jgi:hypothetical protein
MDMTECYDIQELLYQIDHLKDDVERLKDLNVSMAWEIHDRDKIIEKFRNQIIYLKEILLHFDVTDEKIYH